MTARTQGLRLALLWLSGIGLRLAFLAMPPVLPLVGDEFRLSATAVGWLSGLPVLMLACAAPFGSLFSVKFGAARTLVLALVVTSVGSATRAAAPNIGWLYAATILMAVGVAAMQPTLAAAVRAWLPARIGFATAIYANGLLVGEILPVALTQPLLFPAFGPDWRAVFLFWSWPTLVMAALVAIAAPRPVRDPSGTAPAPGRWWPDWSRPTLWRLGLMFGCTNSLYFGANAFIPVFLQSQHQGALIAATLTGLNLGQLPASILILANARRLEGRRWPFVFAGLCAILSVIGLVAGSGAWIVAAGIALGFACGGAVILGLALPPLVSAPDAVPRTAAGMFAISYSLSMLVSIVCGSAWDLSGVAALAFAPLLVCALGLVAFALAGSPRGPDAAA